MMPFNKCMSEFGSLQIVVKNKLFHQYCCALYVYQLWPLWYDIVNKMCIDWHNDLCKAWFAHRFNTINFLRVREGRVSF